VDLISPSIAATRTESRSAASRADAPPGAEPVAIDGRFRTDLQALRGIAILLVLLHHAHVPFLKAGFLGVDLFFTISGFLITNIITAAIERGEFSFRAFYFRRAKRLLPAAYVTLAVTTLVSVFFLNASELSDYAKQVYGALTFTANVSLWMQTGYFESAAKLKPLLHVWSLSIEEQYNHLLPAAL
jgi:peptidoglycan/LPS O-acetylase OafA/YrhL